MSPQNMSKRYKNDLWRKPCSFGSTAILRHVEESYPSIDTPFIRKYFPRAQEGVMNSKAKRGYSLIELIATVAMAGILAAIAVPSWNRLLPSYQLDSSARQVHSELYTMKMRAAAENVGFQLVYSDGAASYSIKRDSAVLMTKPCRRVWWLQTPAQSLSPQEELRAPTGSVIRAQMECANK